MRIEKMFSVCGLTQAPEAILWDMDGTVIDSEPEWTRASRQVVEENGGLWQDDDVKRIAGANKQDHGKALSAAVARGGGKDPGWQVLFTSVVEHVERHFRTDAQLIPGAGEVLKAVHESGTKQALVTASPASMVEALEKVMVRELGYFPFEQTVSAEDHAKGKPSPEPYLLGAKKLGVNILNSLIFEDSPTGIAAAKASGANFVDLRNVSLAELAKEL